MMSVAPPSSRDTVFINGASDQMLQWHLQTRASHTEVRAFLPSAALRPSTPALLHPTAPKYILIFRKYDPYLMGHIFQLNRNLY